MFTAIIPLRKGSKRIPWKNIKLLWWKPLFTYTLDEALKSNYINDIVISTDDQEVIKICNNNYENYLKIWKIKILKRDKNLSSDIASSVDVILDVLEKNNYIKKFILLQATSPFRNCKDIDNSIDLFMKNKNFNVIWVKKVLDSPFWQYKIDGNWKLVNLFDKKYLFYRSQYLPSTYIPNGAIFISSKDTFIKDKTFYWKKIFPFIMDYKKSIDIDEPEDFEYCEFLISKLKNNE